MWIKELINANP